MRKTYGVIKVDKKTKDLVTRLTKRDFAVIKHPDLDNIAVESIIKKRIKGIINFESFTTGRYLNKAPAKLLNENIKIFEIANQNLKIDSLKDNQRVIIEDDKFLFVENKFFSRINRIDKKILDQKTLLAEKKFHSVYNSFIDNTIKYIEKEKNYLVKPINPPKLNVEIKGKHCLVVIRGEKYREDLEMIKLYIKNKKPITIGVDGGGDALLEFGLKPDIIVGDMDSISDKCLRLCKERIVHTYLDGRKSYGLKRLEELGFEYKKFSFPGTSEDIAFLLAYEKKAELIVAVGTHNNMIDFLEKGRNGMASTFLVRSKIGNILVDAKGVSKLYEKKISFEDYTIFFVSLLLPFIIICLITPEIGFVLRLIGLRIRLLLGL